MPQNSSQSPAAAHVNWEDRRATPRHQTDVEINWHLITEKAGDKKLGRLVDLSISGAALRVSQELTVGVLISLKLPPKEKAPSPAAATANGAAVPGRSGQALSVRGTIVNARQLEGGDWRYGIKFDRLYYTLAKWASS